MANGLGALAKIDGAMIFSDIPGFFIYQPDYLRLKVKTWFVDGS